MRTIKQIGLLAAWLALITAVVALVTEGMRLYLNLPTPTPRPAGTPTVVNPTQDFNLPTYRLSDSDYGALQYEDTFDSDLGIWSLEKGAQIRNGFLILPSNSSSHPSWPKNYINFVFETTFQFINPPQSGWAALSAYLKFQNPNCAGYTGNCSDQVAVASQGLVAAWRPNGTNSYGELLAGTQIPGFSPKKSNKLTVIVNGGEFRIFVNDFFVRSFKDTTYTSGVVVIAADDTPIAVDYVRMYAVP